MSMKKKFEKMNKDMEEKAYEEEKAAVEPETEEQTTEEVDKVAQMEKELAELKDKYLRNMAEFENYRRRSIQEKADWIKLATQKLALEVCDVADNFDRALLQVKDEEKENGFVKGVMQIEQQLRTVLEKEGVVKIEALGEEFDPAQHEALAHIPSDFEENIVAAVIQNGYTMHGKMLRPVRVAVSSGKIKNTEQDVPQPEKSGGDKAPDRIEIEVQ